MTLKPKSIVLFWFAFALFGGLLIPRDAGAIDYQIRVSVWDPISQSWQPNTDHAVVLQIDDVLFILEFPNPLPDGRYHLNLPAPRNECLIWVGPNRWNAFTYHNNGARPDEPGTLGGIRRNGDFDRIKLYIKPIR